MRKPLLRILIVVTVVVASGVSYVTGTRVGKDRAAREEALLEPRVAHRPSSLSGRAAGEQSQTTESDDPVPRCANGQGSWDPSAEYLVTPAILEWSTKPLPADIEKVLMQIFEETVPPDDEPGERFRYAWVDLVGDDEKELIAEDPSRGGTGGSSFVILQKKHGVWKQIGGFLGGFIATRTKHKFETIAVWMRTGDHYARYVSRYSPALGVFVDSKPVDIPQELSDLNTGWVDLWRFFWFLNGGREGCFGGNSK